MTTEWPDWRGETVVVVASGPSAADVPLQEARGCARFLAVKDAWRLCPWADMLYACDHHWWEAHDGVPDFAGIKIGHDRNTIRKWPDIRQVKLRPGTDTMQFGEIGVLGWGGNSGFHAVNLAVQLGPKKILLCGFDMNADRGRHFFGEHRYRKNVPTDATMRRWRVLFDAAAPVLSGRGVKVINCSASSSLTAFPKMDFRRALDEP